MDTPAVIQAINQDFALALPASLSADDLRTQLASHINELILHQFDRLVQLLYRMDVSEKKLKQLLQDHNDSDAGLLIAGMVLEREQQKMETRRQFRQPPPDAENADAW
jgi:hypothetical protein